MPSRLDQRPSPDHVVAERHDPATGSVQPGGPLSDLPKGYYVLGADLATLVGPFDSQEDRKIHMNTTGRYPGEWTFQVTADGKGVDRPNNFALTTVELAPQSPPRSR